MKSRRWVFASLVALLALASPASESRTQSGVGPATEDAASARPPVHLRNRFGRLTSAVWRYRQPFVRRDLDPVPSNNPHPEPQPQRDRPERVTLGAGGDKLYVTLAGTEARPGHELAVVDLEQRTVVRRILVGARPYQAALHPGGRFLLVTNELSNYATVVDTDTDAVVGEIALDFYCQGVAFSADGRRAFIANRYLDQVLVVDLRIAADALQGDIVEVGGFDERAFFGGGAASEPVVEALRARGLDEAAIAEATHAGAGGINAILRARCGRCHGQRVGDFIAGPDATENFLSAIENSVPGQPDDSPLLRAVTPESIGGFGDRDRTPDFHAGANLFSPGEPELQRIRRWIEDADNGPGIMVGNPQSHPKDLTLSPDGRHLFVGNTGSMDVAIIDTGALRQVGGIFTGNVAMHLGVVTDRRGEGRDALVILTMGAGFGAAKARDPAGAETWDTDSPAAQLTLLRDPKTTDPLPLGQQHVMGPFDAVDGTWNLKMRDIQSDLIAVDLSRMEVPDYARGMRLDYQLVAREYESHPGWVRYTSDSAEATTGDMKGDLPPELQRVPGSFFEWSVTHGGDLFTTMAGSFEVVQWRLHAHRTDPAERMEPVRIFQTGPRPVGVAVTDSHVLVANQLGESVSIIDRDSGRRTDIPLSQGGRPPLDTDAEKGELIAHSTVFSSDNDSSCLHCHYRDTGDGRGWGAAESIGQDHQGWFTHGGTLGIPQMRNVQAIQPYYFEGTHRLSEGQGADVNEPASSIDFDRPVWAGDFRAYDSPVPESERRPRHEEFKERVSPRKLGSLGYTLDERRNEFIRQQSMRHFGAAYDLKDLYRFVGSFLGSENHLLPNPYDAQHPSVKRGAQLFGDARVMCSVCHTAPEFTNKTFELTHNDTRTLPPLITTTRRGASYTLASVRAVEYANGDEDIDMNPKDRGRVETVEGAFTTMQLRGIFDRPPVFLHHGRARSLREAIATPEHAGLRRFRMPVHMGLEEVRPARREVGFNEMTARSPDGPLSLDDQVLDTHGGTSHLSAGQLDDLVNFMLSIQ